MKVRNETVIFDKRYASYLECDFNDKDLIVKK